MRPSSVYFANRSDTNKSDAVFASSSTSSPVPHRSAARSKGDTSPLVYAACNNSCVQLDHCERTSPSGCEATDLLFARDWAPDSEMAKTEKSKISCKMQLLSV